MKRMPQSDEEFYDMDEYGHVEQVIIPDPADEAWVKGHLPDNPNFIDKLLHQIHWKYLWIWRFLFIWGWNGKKNTFSVAFYKPDMETQLWSIGEY